MNNYGQQMHDGTCDGFYIYRVDYIGGDVIQFDRNWASPVVLFNVSNGTVGWITMNAVDGSFWLSQYGGPGLVEPPKQTGSGGIGSQGLGPGSAGGTLCVRFPATS